METFIIADLHLDHEDILKYTRATRPYANLDEHNEAVVASWNGVVTRQDRVIIVGDFAFGHHGRWINTLRGKKILIRGNHDEMPQVYLQQFAEVHEFGQVRVVCGKLITFCHYPMFSWPDICKGSWHVHGHVHGRLAGSLPGKPGHKRMIDAGWDVWKMPVHFDKLAEAMKMKGHDSHDERDE